ncbi:MAG: radical SAM protein [Calditrichaeota bacterium]|nr:MAG: radical SAM protein [Calditrichota bacterium]
MHHIYRRDWLLTPEGTPRGYIQPQFLREVWFHTGTICNLSCSFCLEGSRPGDNRIEMLTFKDAKPFIHEALSMGVEQFCFTGGEPFVIRDIFQILDYALTYRPCLVLTNGTKPLQLRMQQLLPLKKKPHTLRLRISLDYPDEELHDVGRGKGNYRRALDSLVQLYQMGFAVSVARRMAAGENSMEVEKRYRKLFVSLGLPEDIHIVAFPEYNPPGSPASVPAITEQCMIRYKDASSRAAFMCNNIKMVLKQDGVMKVYACTLVDDDPDYCMGSSLTEAMRYRVMLKHHRCYACFSTGASCCEPALEGNHQNGKPNMRENYETAKRS